MAELIVIRWWRRFLALPNDSLNKALAVTFLVTLTCSTVVSIAAVSLKPMQKANQESERQERLEQMLNAMAGMSDLLNADAIAQLEVRIVDLKSGLFTDQIDPESFDQRAAARNPNRSLVLPRNADVAGIRQRANFAPVFLLRGNQSLDLLILPVRGIGYQSMLYAFLALEPDVNTIAGLTFYEQSETPGLGARLTDPDWSALWPGKLLSDASGKLRITVLRGEASGPHEVDGISGATRTGNGVANMLKFWLGDYGFGPFLANLKAGAIPL
jgi:Na+-transporting NADH:ubiquinone oxidoreductase subunit C